MSRQSPPVPLRERLVEARLDQLAETETVRQLCTNGTVREERALERAHTGEQEVGFDARARHRASPPAGAPDDESHEVEGRRRHRRHVVAELDVVAEHRRELERDAGAPGRREERDPVRSVAIFLREIELVGETHRNDARSEHVLERLPKPEVCGQRDRGDDFRELNPRVDAASLCPGDDGHG